MPVGQETPGRFYLAAALIVVLVAVAVVTARLHAHALRVLTVVTAAVAPLDRGALVAVRGVEGTVRFAEALVEAARQNVRLRAELARLGQVRDENQYLRAENRRLYRLLRLSARPELAGHWVAAEVVARSPSTWFSTVVLNRGRGAGIRPGDVVLSTGGVIGQVLTSSASSSVVLLLTDPASGLPVMDARSGDAGLLNGAGPSSLPVAEFFQTTPNVARGDLLVTSGLGGGIPPGLPVGRVVALRQSDYGLVGSALVTPTSDLDALDVVLVVTRP